LAFALVSMCALSPAAQPAGPAAGPAVEPLTPLQVLSRAQDKLSTAREVCRAVERGETWRFCGPFAQARPNHQAARAAVEVARAAYAAAAAAFWVSPQGATYRAAIEASAPYAR